MKAHTPEQVRAIIAKVEASRSGTKTRAIKAHGISVFTYYNWLKKENGGQSVYARNVPRAKGRPAGAESQAMTVSTLEQMLDALNRGLPPERENALLRCIVSDQALLIAKLRKGT